MKIFKYMLSKMRGLSSSNQFFKRLLLRLAQTQMFCKERLALRANEMMTDRSPSEIMHSSDLIFEGQSLASAVQLTGADRILVKKLYHELIQVNERIGSKAIQILAEEM